MDRLYTINICDTEIEALRRVLQADEEQDAAWPICHSFLNTLLAFLNALLAIQEHRAFVQKGMQEAITLSKLSLEKESKDDIEMMLEG